MRLKHIKKVLMFRNIDQNKKLFFIAIISLFIPGTYFSATRTGINFYSIQQLFYTVLFVFFFAIILSLILKKIKKKIQRFNKIDN